MERSLVSLTKLQVFVSIQQRDRAQREKRLKSGHPGVLSISSQQRAQTELELVVQISVGSFLTSDVAQAI